MHDLFSDLRHALRSLRSHLAFTATAVITLALGMGATTTIYGIVDGIVLRPLAFANADRLVTICEQYPGATADWCSISPPNVEDIAKRSKAIEAIGIGRSWPYHLSTADGPEAVNGGIVTPDLFRALGVRPVLGRLFERSDLLGRESIVAILSYGMWQTRFGGAADVVGRRIVLDGKPVTVVGVLPADFQLPQFPTVVLGEPFTSTPPTKIIVNGADSSRTVYGVRARRWRAPAPSWLGSPRSCAASTSRRLKVGICMWNPCRISSSAASGRCSFFSWRPSRSFS